MNFFTSMNFKHLSYFQDQAKNDNTTLVYYSIMIWYTPEFRSTFSSDDDVEAFVDMIFKIHNDGYKNSNMPVKVNLG